MQMKTGTFLNLNRAKLVDGDLVAVWFSEGHLRKSNPGVIIENSAHFGASAFPVMIVNRTFALRFAICVQTVKI